MDRRSFEGVFTFTSSIQSALPYKVRDVSLENIPKFSSQIYLRLVCASAQRGALLNELT